MDGTLEAPRAEIAEPELRKPMSASHALQLIARACIQEIQAHEPRLRRSRLPESLHQIRVALRRWRTALSVFGEADGEARTKATLKWLVEELNDARDLDVCADAFEARRSGGAGDDALWAALELARTEAYARADEALKSDRFRRLLWTGHTVPQPSDQANQAPSARRAAAAALDHRWRKLKKRGRKLKGMDAAVRHRLRIQAKKVRYTTELCGELFGHPKRQARMAKTLKRMQDSMGVLNDLAVGEAVALRLARRAGSPEAAFAAGVFVGARACEEEPAVLKTARAAYRDFAAVDRFWRARAG